jgi:hypothetical protein
MASIWEVLLKLAGSFLLNKAEGKNQISIEIPLGEIKPENAELKPADHAEIDWTNPADKISKHFTVKEALWLPSWQVMHIPSEEEKANILKQAAKMDLIREFLGVPLHIHCWLRPTLNCPESDKNGQDYNAFVKGAKNSSHKIGLATDYDAVGLNCDDVRAKLEPKLDEWKIRMERMVGGNWVHNDCAPVIAKRYFAP